VDAARFEAAVAEARVAIASGDNETARSLFTDALALWRGPAYADAADASFAQAESARLEELRTGGLEDLVECRLALGEAADLTGELDALTRSHPMRERLWAARMRALYRSGRQGDALKVYEEARAKLASELGIDPSPELRKLHESILRQEDEAPATPTRARPGKQTLSFLFTDIELSTEMLLEAPDEYAYAQTMEEHRAALRDAFVAHGGRRIRTWGDAFFSAFDTATDAVRAAIAAQLALLTTCQEGVRVRMGVHSGEAAVVADDYVGIAVHAAARIGAAAHGGQILVSQSTKELLDGDVGDGVTFLDLGAHQLKDIPEPVRLCQLTHPNLPKAFPPPRTLSAMPHNLPAQATSFVGRSDDVRATAEALERARVVTLTGVGGVGKTRLAQEVGAEVLPRYPDGVWLCEL
ncbi:MAG: BTAD domain-containing putative transcriptional regulator, partial [Candidatus Binatia bacterium]